MCWNDCQHKPELALRLIVHRWVIPMATISSIQLDNIQINGTVPEPATVAGGLLGVLGLCWYSTAAVDIARCVSGELFLGSTRVSRVGERVLAIANLYSRVLFGTRELPRSKDCFGRGRRNQQARRAHSPEESPRNSVPLHTQFCHSKRLACPSSHHVAVRKKKDDLDLIPPEEIRARHIRRFVLLGALIACVLGVAIYFAARPVGGAIKGWQSRRLAREVFALIEQGKWSDANAKARDAYLLRPTEPESWRAIARLASRTTNGHRRWTGGKTWTRHIVLQLRIGATISVPRSRPVR